MIITDQKAILDFLRGDGKDHKGRTIMDFYYCDDVELEKCHDRIQFVFPLHEESNFAETYPIISPVTAEEGMKDKAILNNLVVAKERMERFYAIGKYEDIEKQRKWCKPQNHNLLRITRIIRCLRIFGLTKEAKDFYLKVVTAASRFLKNDDPAFYYWEKAMNKFVFETLR